MVLFGLVATSRSPLTTLAVRMGIRAQRAPVGAGCVVTGVGVGVGPWAFVVRDLWVGGGGGWLSFQSLLGLLSLTPCTPYGGPHHTLTSRAVKGGRLGGLWGGEWWDSPLSPTLSPLSVSEIE